MSPVLIALFFALGIGGWTYSKITRRTGGVTQYDILVTAIVAVMVFIVAWTLIDTFMPN